MKINKLLLSSSLGLIALISNSAIASDSGIDIAAEVAMERSIADNAEQAVWNRLEEQKVNSPGYASLSEKIALLTAKRDQKTTVEKERLRSQASEKVNTINEEIQKQKGIIASTESELTVMVTNAKNQIEQCSDYQPIQDLIEKLEEVYGRKAKVKSHPYYARYWDGTDSMGVAIAAAHLREQIEKLRQEKFGAILKVIEALEENATVKITSLRTNIKSLENELEMLNAKLYKDLQDLSAQMEEKYGSEIRNSAVHLPSFLPLMEYENRRSLRIHEYNRLLAEQFAATAA